MGADGLLYNFLLFVAKDDLFYSQSIDEGTRHYLLRDYLRAMETSSSSKLDLRATPDYDDDDVNDSSSSFKLTPDDWQTMQDVLDGWYSF